MNSQQKQMQILSYQLGLKALSESLELAEKANDSKKVSQILAKMEKLIDVNEKLQNMEKIWLH